MRVWIDLRVEGCWVVYQDLKEETSDQVKWRVELWRRVVVIVVRMSKIEEASAEEAVGM